MFPQNILDPTLSDCMDCRALDDCINVTMFISPQITDMLKAAQLQRAQMEAHKDALLKVIVGIQ